MSEPIYRMQDELGPGPWRPGLSSQWIGSDTPLGGRPIHREAGALDAIKSAHAKRLHIGCAARASRLHLWFSDVDIMRLNAMGFSLVDASSCSVLYETDQQLIIGRREALHSLPKIHARAEAAS
jgi:hypothetical protein